MPEQLKQEIAETEVKNLDSAKLKAKEKLESERKKEAKKEFANPIIDYLLKRCDEDPGFAEDVLRDEKTWNGCFSYIRNEARKKAVNGCAAVEDSTVYEWAEDYYRSDVKEAVKTSTRKTNSTTKKVNTSTKKTIQKVDSSTEMSKREEKCSENEKNAQISNTNDPEKEKTVKRDAAKKQRKKENSSTKSSGPVGQMSIFDLIGE